MVRQGDTALFYYAGHAIEHNGDNYLLPVDVSATDADRIADQSVKLAPIMLALQKRYVQTTIIILDACRTKPMGRGGSGGLAMLTESEGQYIAYATAPGKVASDGSLSDRNGLFTKYLLKALREPGWEIDEVFRDVRQKVHQESKGEQVPWTARGLVGSFFFRGDGKVLARRQVDPSPTPGPDPVPRGAGGQAGCQDEGEPKGEGDYFRRAQCAAAIGKYSEAMVYLKEAIRLNPGNADYYRLRGIVRIQLHQTDPAAADLARAAELNPEDPEAFFEMGKLQLSQGEYEKASRSLQQAFSMAPNRADICLALAEALDKKGLRREAEELRRRAATLN